MKPTLTLLATLLLAPLTSLHAGDAPQPPVKVTQQILNAIHTQPKLIFNPFPAYAKKYLPFAMASSIESTKKGRLWTCWAGGEDGPHAFLVASYSDDQGKTWRDPVFVIDKPFADYYRELDPVRGANVFVSDNEGESWRYRGGKIFKNSSFNEHSVVEKNDGTLWMLSRCNSKSGGEAAQSFSTDGGKTWQEQTTFFPHVNSKAVFRRLQSGNILLIRHGEDMTKAAPAREYLTAFLSLDDGKTWPAKLLLGERRTISYPDIAQAPNGDIYVHYDRNRYSDAEILFARFREEDVQAGKLVSKDASLKNLVKSKQLGMNRGVANAATSPKNPNNHYGANS